jgi:hypothetical protein
MPPTRYVCVCVYVYFHVDIHTPNVNPKEMKIWKRKWREIKDIFVCTETTVEPTVYYSGFMIYLCFKKQHKYTTQNCVFTHIHGSANAFPPDNFHSMWHMCKCAHVLFFLLLIDYLKLIYGHPGVGWKALKHWYQELKTTAPVADKQHHAN